MTDIFILISFGGENMADNSSEYIKILKNSLRKSYFNMQYIGQSVMQRELGGKYLSEQLKKGFPFMVCRLGVEESRCVFRWMNRIPYSKRNINNIQFNAGVFPNNKETIDEFCDIYTTALSCTDVLLVWGCLHEAYIKKHFAKSDIPLIENSTMKMLDQEEPWTKALAGKKVLVVHPFTETIEKQYEKRKNLFINQETLPEFSDLQLVKAIQSNAGESENLEYSSWSEALEKMKSDISCKEYDVALIAAGAYGIPLAAHCKNMGKQAIHMASYLQLFFGIKGKRWAGYEEWNKYFNEYWVYPSDSETPVRKSVVEGGSYWK